MKIKLKELHMFIEHVIKEDVIPDTNGEIDLAEPEILWNHTYDMKDQETSTRIANQRITINPDIAKEIDDAAKFAPQLKLLAMENLVREAPEGWAKSIAKQKKDKNKKTKDKKNPWSMSYWAEKHGSTDFKKSKQKYKP